MAEHEVIYLTGAPATGKSSTAERLARAVGGVRLSYGELLTDQLSAKVSSQDELRAESARVITPADVERADTEMIERIGSARRESMVIVDSHAITIESFGFRAVPYSADQLKEIGFTWVICLYAAPEVIAARISSDSGGRPLPALDDLARHEALQGALALAYAHSLGVPIAFVNSDIALEEVVTRILELVSAPQQ